MIPDLEILKPRSLDEALVMLHSHGPDGARLIAGGTDLVVGLKNGDLRPGRLIALDFINGLDQIRENDGVISIGPRVTHAQIMKSHLLKEKAPILPLACSHVGSPPLRNRGTVGGNVAHASPCGDTLAPLAVLDATVVLQTKNGERRLAFTDCFRGPKQTNFRKNEMITAIEFPVPDQPANGFYLCLGQRKAMAVTKLSVAGQLVFDEDGTARSVRIAYGAVAPTVMRGPAAEAMLMGKKLTPELISEAAVLGSREIKPISDIRSTKKYRAEVTGVLLKRGLASLMGEEPDEE